MSTKRKEKKKRSRLKIG